MNNFDNSKKIKYNYYNNLATPTSSDNHYIYKGKSNQPNIVLIDKGEVKTFSTEKFQIKNSDSNPVLIIEHSPITNFDKKVFVHLPLVSNSNKPNDIDHLINNKNKELELNSVLPSTENCVFNECNKGINIKFLSPISINTDLKEYFSNYKEGFQNTVIESAITVNQSDNTFSIFDTNETTKNEKINKVTVGMYIEDPKGGLFRIKTKEEDNTFTTAPEFNPTEPDNTDLSYKFFSMGDKDANIICDVAPLSTDETVMYSSQLQTSFDKSKENFIQLFSFFFAIMLFVLWAIIIPIVFNYWTGAPPIDWISVKKNIKFLGWVDFAIILVGIISFITSYSVIDTSKDINDSSANTLLTFLSIWFSYVTVNLFYRYALPTKLIHENHHKYITDDNEFNLVNIFK